MRWALIGIASLAMLGALATTFVTAHPLIDPHHGFGGGFLIGFFVLVTGASVVAARRTDDRRRATIILVSGLALSAFASALLALTMLPATSGSHPGGTALLMQMLLLVQATIVAGAIWSRRRVRSSTSAD